MRLVTRDHPKQLDSLLPLLDEEFQLTATVLVETEWVLRSAYGWTKGQRVQALDSLLDLPNAASVPAHARWALSCFEKGADFADMMHVATAEGASSFATFDRRLARTAGADAPVAIETLR